MLGWEFFITKQSVLSPGRADDAAPTLATWTAGLDGTDWLEDLIAKRMATDLGGNGYPARYAVKAGVLAELLEHGVPKHGGPLVLGDDYVQPSGWTANAKIKIKKIRAIDPDEQLIVEAWDQS